MINLKFPRGIFILFACLLTLTLQAQIIYTTAGNGRYSYSGDGGPASMAQLFSPTGIKFDGAGNFYVVDDSNNVVRRIDAGGIIHEFAGTGNPGYLGDGAAATAASINYPFFLTVGNNGLVFIADRGNCVIRKVDSFGVIETVAGNGVCGYSFDNVPATGAKLNNPNGVVFDGSGNYYVADNLNHRIRKIDATGVITTIAGTGIGGYNGDEIVATAAQLNNPTDIAFDAHGNLFIEDDANFRVRKIDTSGIIHTIAGNGFMGLTGDGGPATIAEIWEAKGIAIDNSGNIYFTQRNGHNVRRVDTNGIITNIAGIGTAGFSGDGGPATAAMLNGPIDLTFDASGNLYISDNANNRIRRVDVSGMITTWAGTGLTNYSGDGGPASTAELNYPGSVALDHAGSYYIADRGNSCLRKVSGSTGGISTFAGSPLHFGFGGDGGPATAASMAYPINVAVNPAGDIVFCDSGNSVMRKVSGTTGGITTIAGNALLGAGFSGDYGPATAAQISNSCSVAFDSTGDMYLLDGGNACLRKVSGTTGVITTIAGTPGFVGFGGDGGPATLAKLNNPTAIAIDSLGNIYIADGGNSCLRKVSGTTGGISTIAGIPTIPGATGDGSAATAATLNFPTGVAVLSSGKIFIADASNSTMRVISPAGVIHTVAGTGVAGFNGDGPCTTVELNRPRGLCFDPMNNCYVADAMNNRIRYIDYSVLDADLSEKDLTHQLNISPNPASQTTTILALRASNEACVVYVFDLTGREVGHNTGMLNQQIEIQTGELSEGVYMLKVVSKSEIHSGKLVVLR